MLTSVARFCHSLARAFRSEECPVGGWVRERVREGLQGGGEGQEQEEEQVGLLVVMILN